jgi:hypothetical protein
MVRAADDVSDTEVEVVGHRRELVRGAPVRTEERHAVEAERAVNVTQRSSRPLRALRCGGVDLRALALPYRALVPGDPEPAEIGQDRVHATLGASRGVGVVDAEHEHAAAFVREAPVRRGGQRVAEMERPRRARREADADGHARDHSAAARAPQASIGTWPGSDATRSSHAPIAG